MKRAIYGAWALGAAGCLIGCDRAAPQPVAGPAESAAAADISTANIAATDLATAADEPTAPAAARDQVPVSAAAAPDSPTPSTTDGSPPAASQPAAGQPDPFVAATSAAAGQWDASRLAAQSEFKNRPFNTLQPLASSDPQALLEHLRQIDAALQDLVLAGSSSFMDEQAYTAGGLRLGRMKQAAGEKLAESPQATPEQRKAGILAQLVALSHMSGLRDVQAAQDLERFAKQLAASDDADLVHQAHVVLIGFQLQSLQNGLRQQPDELLAAVGQLLQRPQDRGYPEFMVLQQARQVLNQMGFEEAAESVQQTLIAAYRTASDPQLRGEAWLSEVQDSQAYLNFLQAFRNLGSESFDTAAALSAVRGLYEAFPSVQTLEQIATTVVNIEYSGQVALSQEVAGFVEQKRSEWEQADTSYIDTALAHHTARMQLVGQPLQLQGLVGFDGQPLDWQRYAGDVVLVDFWASWCVECLREIPTIRQVHADFASQGFQVLSINMDENLANARDFVQKQKFPWQSYHSADPQLLGFQSPLARQLGINAIPFMMLIGRDGRVAALHVRGEQLRPAVQRQLAVSP